jgi:hypothetical protein
MEDLTRIFETLKEKLIRYQPPLAAKREEDKYFDLWSFKHVEIAGRKKKEVFFAGIIIQKNYVGFYFMPIYTDTDLKTVFQPELLALLKGKSCFHIRKLTPELLRQIEDALKIGFEMYQQRGWV